MNGNIFFLRKGGKGDVKLTFWRFFCVYSFFPPVEFKNVKQQTEKCKTKQINETYSKGFLISNPSSLRAEKPLNIASLYRPKVSSMEIWKQQRLDLSKGSSQKQRASSITRFAISWFPFLNSHSPESKQILYISLWKCFQVWELTCSKRLFAMVK